MTAPRLPRLRRYTIYTLITLVLLVLLMAAAVSTFLATETGSRFVAQTAITQVNNLDDISLDVGTIRGNLLQGLQLDQIEFAMPGVNASVVNVAASWNPYSLFAGSFLISELSISGLHLDIPVSEDEPETDTASTDPLADFTFTPLPVAIVVDQFTMNNAVFNAGGSVTELQSLRSRISLEAQDLDLTELEVDYTPVTVNGEISARLVDRIPLQLALQWQYNEALPMELGTATGQLQISGDLRSLEISHALTSPFTIQSDGQLRNPLQVDLLDIAFVHRAANLTLPLEPEPLQIRDLELATTGTLDALALNLSGDVSSESYPSANILLAADVVGSTAQVENLRVRTATGEVSASASVDWQNVLTVDGDFSVRETDVASYLQQDLPAEFGLITAGGEFQFSQDDDGPDVSLTLASASAQIDEYEVNASGALSWLNNRLQIESLLVETDSNQLTVQGHYEEQIDLQWQIDAPALAQFLPGVTGRITGSGFATGDPAQPDVDGALTVESLATDSFSIESLQVAVGGVAGEYALDVSLRNARIEGEGETTISSATINAAGSLERQSLNATIESSLANFDLSVSGAMTDPANQVWAGTVDSAALSGPVGDWRLEEPIALGWQNNQLSVDDTCWAQRQTRLCLSVVPDLNAGYEIEGQLSEFSLAEFNLDSEHLIPLALVPRLPEDISLEGMFNASLSARILPEQEPQFSFQGQAPGSVLTIRTVATDEFGAVTSDAEILEQDYTWEDLSLGGDLQDGAWQFAVNAQLGERTIEDSVVELNGRIQADLAISSDGILAGTTTAAFQDLGWLTALVPDLTNVVGELESEIDIQGSLDDPQITGFARLSNGSFLVERTGMNYREVEMSVNSTDSANGTFSASVTAGEGVMTLSGELTDVATPSWRVTADIEGDDFQLVQLPELDVQIEPDLEIIADANQFAILGDLFVPQLQLTLRELPPSAVDISRDVVIVNYPQERPEMGRSFTTGQTSVFNLPLVFDINLQLGENVRFAGFGLQTGLEGELNIRQLSNGTNLIYGELDVSNGSFELYGQTLRLREGEILFLGNYHNPALNIRAVREVGSLTVGVLMNGTVRNLRSELFSTPSLPESDIISVMVTGRPVSELRSGEGTSVLGAITTLGLRRSESLSQQIGASLGLDTVAITNSGDVDSSVLTLGKYITPDIFIRYGVGLFDNESRVAVDYSINDRLTLQAESGDSQSVDLTYKVER